MPGKTGQLLYIVHCRRLILDRLSCTDDADGRRQGLTCMGKAQSRVPATCEDACDADGAAVFSTVEVLLMASSIELPGPDTGAVVWV